MSTANPTEPRVALIPGSFNPFTLGHESLVERALKLFDGVVIAIGVNADKPGEDAEANRRSIERLYASEPRVRVVTYTGLTVDACREHGARWMVRGIRNVRDMEYERDLADVNRELSGIETVLLFTLPEYQSISSSMVRELERYGHDASRYLPAGFMV